MKRFTLAALALAALLVTVGWRRSRPAPHRWEVVLVGVAGDRYGGQLATSESGQIESRAVRGAIPDTIRFTADRFTLSLGLMGSDNFFSAQARKNGREYAVKSASGIAGAIVLSYLGQ